MGWSSTVSTTQMARDKFCLALAEVISYDLQCTLPTTLSRSGAAAEAFCNLLPRVALGPHPDQMALFLF